MVAGVGGRAIFALSVLASCASFGYEEPVYAVTVAEGTNSLDEATVEVTQNGGGRKRHDFAELAQRPFNTAPIKGSIMKTSRRNFAKIAVAAAFAPKETLWAEEPPLLKVGLITDTHVGKTKESCSRARLAYELFRDIGVDMIVNDGDVADHHYPTGYVAYREMVEETFAGVPAERRPQELFVYAWHDAYDYKGHPREACTRDAPEAFADMQRLIKSPNGPYAEGEIKGFPYVVIPQFEGREGKLDWDRFDKMLSAAEKSHPGKPVFAIAHVPPADTTRGRHGSEEKRRVLNRHPMAVNISGHSHGSMRDDRAIWQGEFTSINIYEQLLLVFLRFC